MITAINYKEKFKQIQEYWTPHIAGELNGQYILLAKAKGKLVWHSHEGEDEYFHVFKGQLTIHFRDHSLDLNQGEFCIVPKGTDHLPEAKDEAHIILFEPKETAHTGSTQSELTKTQHPWI